MRCAFFQLSPQACKVDLEQLLGYVRSQCEQEGEEVLGSVMFTCGGRNGRFFGEDCADAKRFQEAFPSVPLVGFWAGGEIGPQALAEAAPNEATRTGNAAFQGFTAVFGIFRAPRPSRGTLLAGLGDDDVGREVGSALAQLAREAKERGNAAFRESDSATAIVHYNRALSLANVPSASVTASEQALLLTNRAAAHLKVDGSAAAALKDTHSAIELNPLNTKAHYRKAQALLLLSRRDEALACLRKAVELLPEEAELSDLLEKHSREANA